MNDLLTTIWNNAETFEEFKEHAEKQGYKIKDEGYLRSKFGKGKKIEYSPTLAELEARYENDHLLTRAIHTLNQ